MASGRAGANVVACVAAAVLAGCIYDSRWVENEAEKKRSAARLHPATLARQGAQPASVRVAPVRAHATRAYSAETLNWEQQFDALLAEANGVLGPSIGLHLENGGTELWSPDEGEAEPTVALGALAREDSGAGVQWVAGFLQSVPKLVTDYHRLGVGRQYSKYVVVRGSTDAREMEYVEKLEGASEAERAKIYSERRRHKMVTVFLHEIAHTLGALHRTARDTIMSPTYDASERGFDDATLDLLRITLPEHFSGAPYRAFPAVLSYLEKNETGWVSAERDEMLQSLRAAVPQMGRAAAAPSSEAPQASLGASAKPPLAGEAPLPFSSMTREDRSTFDRALTVEKTGDAKGAWTLATPLFEGYPRVLEVQELRCRLAKARRFVLPVVEAHCERFAALSGSTAH